MPFKANKDFSKLWLGQTISEIGSRITREGIPLAALLTLSATAWQMGILSAISSASVVVFSLAAGVVVDRLKKRSVMVATDFARAGLLATIPLAAHTHVLGMSLLLAIAAVVGALAVHFDVAYQSYLPVIVPADELLEGNRRLSLSSSTAEMLGPALAGVLVQAITAPLAILVDALSFVVSGLSVLAIKEREVVHASRRDEALFSEALSGIRFIRAHPALRALLLRSATAFLSMGLIFPLYLLNAIRVIHMSTSQLGIVIALGGAGSVAGAYVSERLSRRHGLGPTFFVTAALIGLAQLLIPLSSYVPRIGLICLCVQHLIGDSAWTIYIVNETALRQLLAPPAVIGRVNAAMQLATRGMLPFGALFGGFLAQRMGLVPALSTGAAGVLLSCLWLVPLRKDHEIRALESDQDRAVALTL